MGSWAAGVCTMSLIHGRSTSRPAGWHQPNHGAVGACAPLVARAPGRTASRPLVAAAWAGCWPPPTHLVRTARPCADMRSRGQTNHHRTCKSPCRTRHGRCTGVANRARALSALLACQSRPPRVCRHRVVLADASAACMHPPKHPPTPPGKLLRTWFRHVCSNCVRQSGPPHPSIMQSHCTLGTSALHQPCATVSTGAARVRGGWHALRRRRHPLPTTTDLGAVQLFWVHGAPHRLSPCVVLVRLRGRSGQKG